VDELRAANRANWDDRAAVHARSQFYDLDGWLRERRGPRTHELEALGDVAGLRLAHLQCHIGTDTLAFARVGAVVTGLDFSERSVEVAQDLARQAELTDRASFVCADVYDAVEVLGSSAFDIVYVSLGALNWLPSVDRWAAQVAGLLAPGGRLYLHDGHPLSSSLAEHSLEIERSYFEEAEPFTNESGETYTDHDVPVANAQTFEWNHSLGETLNAVIRHGLVVDRLDEHDWTAWPRYPWLVPHDRDWWAIPPGRVRIPLSFTLLAHRPAPF
jgi:SAM-dependent methyltransferase